MIKKTSIIFSIELKKTAFSILFLLFSTFIFGQFSVGLKGGYSAHGIYFEPSSLDDDQVALLLPNAGLVVSFNNELNAGLQMEFNYAPKGFKEELSTPDSFFVRHINYLEVPIFSHFEIGHGKVRPVIMAGPYFGFKLSESADSSNYTSISVNNQYDHYHLPVREVDFGIKAVVGLRYNPTPKIGFFIEARYDFQMAGGRDIFFDRPNDINASRLKEIGGTFGILWHIIPQELKLEKKGYTPKQDLYDQY